MMDRIDLFHLPFYKKEAFTGSDRGIRFWIGKVTVGEEEAAQDYLRQARESGNSAAPEATPDATDDKP